MSPRNSKQYIVVLATVLALVGLTVNIGMIPAGGVTQHAATGENHPLIPVTYNISFHQSGLPTGIPMYVTITNIGTLNGATYVNFTGLSNGSYTFTVANEYSSNGQNEYLPSPSSGTIILSGKNQNVQVSFYNQTVSAPVSSKTFDLNFSITNLPSLIPNVNWAWTATLVGIDIPYTSSSVHSTGASAQFTGLQNGTYQYSLAFPSGTSLSPQTAQLTISGKNLSVSLTFSLAKLYRITFTEVGLPGDATFTTVVYNIATGASLSNTTLVSKSNYVTFALVNQSYSYRFSTDTPFSNYYTASPYDGQIVVNGAPFTVGTNFVTSQHTYGILFKIANPPSNNPGAYWYWYAIVNGTSAGYSYNATLMAPGLINGTYSFVIYTQGISLTPVIGTLTINGSFTVVSLKVQESYTVTVNAKSTSKLYSNPSYSGSLTTVVAGITTFISKSFTTTGILTFTGIPNGTYNYVLTPTSSWSLSNTQGTIKISGKNVTLNLTATIEFTYPVIFTESGLVETAGSNPWGVIIDSGFFYNDSSPVSNLPTIAAPTPDVICIPNGTYWVQAYVYQGGHYYFTQPQQISVNGQVAQYNIQFPTTSSQPQSGITSSIVALIIVVVIAAAVIGLLAYNSRRKRTGP